mgnify:CR=1 FL=1
MHTREADGDGCTVTNGDMGDGWERMVIMADGYHGRHYRIHHTRWATDMQHLQGQYTRPVIRAATARGRGAIVSVFSGRRGRV